MGGELGRRSEGWGTIDTHNIANRDSQRFHLRRADRAKPARDLVELRLRDGGDVFTLRDTVLGEATVGAGDESDTTPES